MCVMSLDKFPFADVEQPRLKRYVWKLLRRTNYLSTASAIIDTVCISEEFKSFPQSDGSNHYLRICEYTLLLLISLCLCSRFSILLRQKYLLFDAFFCWRREYRGTPPYATYMYFRNYVPYYFLFQHEIFFQGCGEGYVHNILEL